MNNTCEVIKHVRPLGKVTIIGIGEPKQCELIINMQLIIDTLGIDNAYTFLQSLGVNYDPYKE